MAEWAYDATGQKGLLNTTTSYTPDWKITVNPGNYDARNRLLGQTWQVDDLSSSGVEHEYAMAWTYDQANRTKTITYPSGDNAALGDTLTYTYQTSTGLPATAVRSDGLQVVSSATYTPQGAPLSLTQGGGSDPNRVVRGWDYYTDTLRPFTATASKVGQTGDILSLSYRYTPGGTIVQRNDFRNSGQAECYGYDGRNQLTSAFTSDNDAGTSNDCVDGADTSGQGVYNHAYAYNPSGSLITVDGASWVYGAGAPSPHALTSTPSSSFAYDAEGRMTSRTVLSDTQTLDWTPTGMTDTITEGSDVTSFAYTADDVRILREDPDGTQTITIGGVYDHTIPASGPETQTSYHTFAGQTVAYTIDNGTTENVWYQYADLLGSIAATHNPATQATIRRWYEPWGTQRAATGTPPTEHGYTGQRQDPTSLYHYNARLYDPTHATFLTPDIIVPDPANPGDHNRYAYTRNNPVNHTDPSGHFLHIVIGAAVGAVVGAAVSAVAQKITTGTIDWGAVGASAAGGAVAGALATATAGASLAVQAAASGVGSAAASQTTRALTGQEVGNLGDIASDAAIGILTFGLIRGGSTLLRNAKESADETAGSLFNTLTHSDEGIASFKTQAKITRGHKGEIEAHHLIERRFVDVMGGNPRNWPSVVLTKAEHRVFTNAWRQEIPYGPTGTRLATQAQVQAAARRIYANYPEILTAIGLR